MKKSKIMIPVMTLVLAVGLAFAHAKADNTLFTAYVNDSGTWIAVDVNCPGSGNTCRVQFVDTNGDPLSAVLDVYPIPSFEDEDGDPVEPLASASANPELIVIQ